MKVHTAGELRWASGGGGGGFGLWSLEPMSTAGLDVECGIGRRGAVM